MMSLPALLMIFATITVLVTNTFFVLDPSEQAIVFQFRQKQRVIQAPGLYAKVPFLQDVSVMDKRVLPLELPTQTVTMSEQKLLSVDAFARWRIKDPLKFFESLRDETNAKDRLGSILNASMRNTLGTWRISDLLSDKRAEIIFAVQTEVNKAAESYGVEIVSVRIRRADLPDATVRNVYSRMQSERQREAAALRAEGERLANETRAKAEAERTRILSEAERDAQRLRGEGDKEALRLISEATAKDPRFYAFYRQLEAYRTAMTSDKTVYLLTPDQSFLSTLHDGAPKALTE